MGRDDGGEKDIEFVLGGVMGEWKERRKRLDGSWMGLGKKRIVDSVIGMIYSIEGMKELWDCIF